MPRRGYARHDFGIRVSGLKAEIEAGSPAAGPGHIPVADMWRHAALLQGAQAGDSAAIEVRGIVLGWSRGRAKMLRGELYDAWKAWRGEEKCW